MADGSKIQWTDATWNPVRGCTKVSAGCKHCYAERFAERFRGVAGHPFEQGFDVRLVPEALELPLRWRKPRRVFVNSMSDLFHEAVPDDFVIRVFDLIRRCHTERPGHVFQLLTKRAARMQDFCARLRFDGSANNGEGRMWVSDRPAVGGFAPPGDGYAVVRALSNLWAGVSVEDQATADERIPHLLATPAAVRFLSCEPLLGPVDLHRTEAFAHGTGPIAGQCVDIDGDSWHRPDAPPCTHCGHRMPRVDLVIAGGESGPGARPCDVAWVHSLVKQCRDTRTPCFVKQLGAMPVMPIETWGRLAAGGPAPVIRPGAPAGFERLALQDRKGGDPAEWPTDLRVREMPEVRR